MSSPFHFPSRHASGKCVGKKGMHSESAKTRYTRVLAECLLAEAATIMEGSYHQFYSCLIKDIVRGGVLPHVKWSALHKNRTKETYLLALLAAAVCAMRGGDDQDLAAAVEARVHGFLGHESDVVTGLMGDFLQRLIRAAEVRSLGKAWLPSEAIAVQVITDIGVLETEDARRHFPDPESVAALARHLAVFGADWWRTAAESARMAA